jgi:Arc/MetJ family transcription regulator
VIRRTTIELDEDLVQRARRALGAPTIRATVEEALRRVADEDMAVERDRTARQLALLDELPRHLDLEVLGSEQMWR